MTPGREHLLHPIHLRNTLHAKHQQHLITQLSCVYRPIHRKPHCLASDIEILCGRLAHLAGVDVELPIGLGSLGGQARQQHIGPNACAGIDASGGHNLIPELPDELVRVAKPGDVHESLITGDGLHRAAGLHQQLVHLASVRERSAPAKPFAVHYLFRCSREGPSEPIPLKLTDSKGRPATEDLQLQIRHTDWTISAYRRNGDTL